MPSIFSFINIAHSNTSNLILYTKKPYVNYIIPDLNNCDNQTRIKHVVSCDSDTPTKDRPLERDHLQNKRVFDIISESRQKAL